MSFTPLEHQAAGHPGLLENEDGSMFLKLTNQQEVDFYIQMNHHDPKDKSEKEEEEGDLLGSRLIHWMPDMFGVLQPGISPEVAKTQDIDLETKAKAAIQSQQMGAELQDKQYIALRNVLHGFKRPCVLDVKLGKVLTDDSANLEKQQRLMKVSDETTSGSLHLRVCGMTIPGDSLPDKKIDGIDYSKSVCIQQKKSGEKYLVFDKFFGRSLTKETVSQGIELFFRYNSLPKDIQDLIIEMMYVRLQMLYNCLLDEEVRIVSGSLLFVYEGDADRAQEADDPIIFEHFINDDDDDDDEPEEEDDCENPPRSKLHFIDFAHAKRTPGLGHDENILVGVENLMEIVEKLIG